MNITNVETIPISLVPSPASPVGGTAMQLTITVNSAPSADTTVQIDCSNSGLLTSPSGSWPYQAPVAAGATTAIITLGTNTVTGSTSVEIQGGGATADMSNPSNWTVILKITVANQPI